MDRERWEKIEQLLDEVLDLDTEARAERLARETGEDADLRREVERLLAADSDDGGGILDRGLAPFADRLLDEDSEAVGARVGPYRLARRIGRGGMGSVFLAERVEGDFEQRVALKIVRASRDRHDLVARFRHERNILARLRHPNIATLYDGGLTDDGIPYFAMEYVEGARITDWCDERRLDVDARVTLFDAVCRAVSHAHRNLVIHRDLKPSNVLVTGDATVKLLDFGIAKVFDPEEAGVGDSGPAGPEVTVTAERYFTPAYAAPEQVLGEPTSTATDVFALGVLLYEILTGRNPHGDTTRNGELARAVVETDPPSPSTVVGDAAAAARATTISDLRQKLRGDLDNILQKALRKAPEERYSSVEDLRLDLERFRRQLPVSVRRATLPYRFAKYARRHRVAATAVVALALAVVAGMVGVAWQANVAARERDRARAEAGRAEAVKDFLLEVFTAADPTQEPGGADVTARELAERGASRLDERLAEAPELRADLEGLLGQVFLRVAEYERADSLLASAGAQFRRSGRSRDAVQSLLNRADVAHWQARAADAEALCRESLALAEAELPADDVLHRTARSSLATALIDQGHYEDAAREYDVALRAAQAAHDEPDAEVAQLWMQVGVVRRALGDYPGSAEAAEEALRIARLAEPDGGLETARILGSLADILDEVDRPDEAVQAGREAVEMYRRMFGDRGHPELAMTLVNLAGAVRAQGDLEEAIALGREGVDEFTKALGAEHPHVAQAWNNLAVTLNRAGHKDEALEAYSSAVRLGRAALGRGHPRLAPWLANYANALVARGDYATAEQIYDEGMEIVRGPESEPVANTYVMLGLANVYRKTNRPEASERLTREAWQIRKDTVGSGHSAELIARITLASLLSESGKFEEARDLLDSSIVDARAGGPSTQGRLVQALDERAILAREAGESMDTLAGFLRELLAVRREANPDDPRVAKLEEEIARLGS